MHPTCPPLAGVQGVGCADPRCQILHNHQDNITHFLLQAAGKTAVFVHGAIVGIIGFCFFRMVSTFFPTPLIPRQRGTIVCLIFGRFSTTVSHSDTANGVITLNNYEKLLITETLRP
ncbi:MAG: hypothetical protein OZ917_01215 [Candidatus Brocadiaceae bacterium]|nr:hypothetical protein [Candidatus Brocadiaceae bacterium]